MQSIVIIIIILIIIILGFRGVENMVANITDRWLKKFGLRGLTVTADIRGWYVRLFVGSWVTCMADFFKYFNACVAVFPHKLAPITWHPPFTHFSSFLTRTRVVLSFTNRSSAPILLYDQYNHPTLVASC